MQMRETINWFKMICCPIIIYDYFKCSDNENELEFLLLRRNSYNQFIQAKDI